MAAAQKLFTSGVPIFMMPLDSTQLKLDEEKRTLLFRQSTPLTDALTLLYHQWGQQTPTLFDAMAVAYVIKPALCPVTPFHVVVDKDGSTRTDSAGAPNRLGVPGFGLRRILSLPAAATDARRCAAAPR